MNHEREHRPRRDWTFPLFLLGAAAGAVFGLGLVGWYGSVGYPGKRYPQVHVGFWALSGGLLGLAAGLLHRLTRRR